VNYYCGIIYIIISKNEKINSWLFDEYYLVKKDAKSIRPANYTIDNQKITFEFLKSHLWSAADILRGSLIQANIDSQL